MWGINVYLHIENKHSKSCKENADDNNGNHDGVGGSTMIWSWFCCDEDLPSGKNTQTKVILY